MCVVGIGAGDGITVSWGSYAEFKPDFLAMLWQYVTCAEAARGATTGELKTGLCFVCHHLNFNFKLCTAQAGSNELATI